MKLTMMNHAVGPIIRDIMEHRKEVSMCVLLRLLKMLLASIHIDEILSGVIHEYGISN